MAGRRPARFEQRSLNPLRRRLRQLRMRLFEGRFVHGHRVDRIRIGTGTFKRIRFGDSATAEQAAFALEHFDGSPALPRLYARFDNELLVEFVEGERLERIDASAAEALAGFYSSIHQGGTHFVPLEQSGVAQRTIRELEFLQQAGVVDAGRCNAARAALDRLAPRQIRLGWDYTDGVAKNFVWRTDGSLVGIDVEALQRDSLVGTGIAKTLSRGDRDYRARFLQAFSQTSSMDLEKELPFVELCCEVRWLKDRLLKGSALEPERLARFEA